MKKETQEVGDSETITNEIIDYVGEYYYDKTTCDEKYITNDIMQANLQALLNQTTVMLGDFYTKTDADAKFALKDEIADGGNTNENYITKDTLQDVVNQINEKFDVIPTYLNIFPVGSVVNLPYNIKPSDIYGGT